ncbi:MAG: hypothetical protein JW768_16650 [Chitinispirillaceae bacterium]|nr:hypothetical protein [Chitinispirillaceae bacterium]
MGQKKGAGCFWIWGLLCFPLQAAEPLVISNQTVTMTGLVNQSVTMRGSAELHLTSPTAPIDASSTINFVTDNGWVFFDGIRPDTVQDRYLDRFLVSGNAASVEENVKLVQHVNGTVIISRGGSYRPLYLFDSADLSGSRDTLGVGLSTTGSPRLGRAVRSFLLKRGYCATFANNPDGTGQSTVFIADTSDIAFNLPVELSGAVALIRVADFRWAGKKGMGGGNQTQRAIFNLSAYYDWGNGGAQYPSTAYTPMMWGKTDSAGVARVSRRTDVSHLLAFNEPDNPNDQSGAIGNLYMTDTAVASYRHLLRTGLRLGSPAVTDNTRGWNWLDTFMTKASRLNYRVDFIAIHYYQKRAPADLYNRLRSLWNKYARPVWVTEFNYGATWNPLPADSMEYYQGLKAFVDMLDTCAFVEHYFVYPWWGTADSVLSIFKTETPPTHSYAGRWYAEKPDCYGYRSSRINKGVPIEISQVTHGAKAASSRRPRMRVRGHHLMVHLELERASYVSLELFSLAGRLTGTSLHRHLSAGSHVLHATLPPPGRNVCLYRFRCGENLSTGSLLFLLINGNAGP